MSKDKEFLKAAARVVEARVPDNHGFILLAVPHGGEGRLTYISSLRREDAVNVMKEWLIKCGAEEDWMKHIE